MTILERKIPVFCQHCRKLTSTPPAYLKILSVMAGGRGKPEPRFTAGDITRLAKLKRPMAEYLIKAALLAKVLELVPSPGTRVYRRAWYGRQILGRWKSAGWRP
jgi:hypothetical protein